MEGFELLVDAAVWSEMLIRTDESNGSKVSYSKCLRRNDLECAFTLLRGGRRTTPAANRTIYF